MPLIDFSKYRHELEVFDEDYEPEKMPEPTGVPPGPSKVEVLRARVDAGEELWHPNDADCGGIYVGRGSNLAFSPSSPRTANIRRYESSNQNGTIVLKQT
jgi:hypothetical protein